MGDINPRTRTCMPYSYEDPHQGNFTYQGHTQPSKLHIDIASEKPTPIALYGYVGYTVGLFT